MGMGMGMGMEKKKKKVILMGMGMGNKFLKSNSNGNGNGWEKNAIIHLWFNIVNNLIKTGLLLESVYQSCLIANAFQAA